MAYTKRKRQDLNWHFWCNEVDAVVANLLSHNWACPYPQTENVKTLHFIYRSLIRTYLEALVKFLPPDLPDLPEHVAEKVLAFLAFDEGEFVYGSETAANYAAELRIAHMGKLLKIKEFEPPMGRRTMLFTLQGYYKTELDPRSWRMNNGYEERIRRNSRLNRLLDFEISIPRLCYCYDPAVMDIPDFSCEHCSCEDNEYLTTSDDEYY